MQSCYYYLGFIEIESAVSVLCYATPFPYITNSRCEVMLAESCSPWNGVRPISQLSDLNSYNWGGINLLGLAVNDRIPVINAKITANDAGKRLLNTCQNAQ